jgi:predicted DCC family thiol-disulfide oxidoreductase YuxK
MLLVTGLLTLADAGAALSLDARRNGSRSHVRGWPERLLRLQLSIVYGFAALAKVNAAFLSGSVVASYLRREGLLAVPAEWRSQEPMMVLSLLAICSEAFLAIALWMPRWRPAAMVVGLGLHIFISAWLSPTYALTVFSLLMLPLLIVFLDVQPASRVVVWDDACSFCAGWVRWLARLDWLGGVRFVPRSQLAMEDLPVTQEAAAEALQLVVRGRTYSGFRAVGRVAEILPVSYLWAPLLRLPPIAAIGDRVYRRVAARRLCSISARTALIKELDAAGK